MINRRHIRVKVMQSVYAFLKSNSDNIAKEENFLKNSVDKMHDLYVLMLDILLRVRTVAEEKIEISRNKYSATYKDINPNIKFINNKVFKLVDESMSFQTYREKKQLDNWHLEEKYVKIIFENLTKSELYKNYMKSGDNSFKSDLSFIVDFYINFIAPDEKLFDYYEDINISWVDDIPSVNTLVVKTLRDLKENKLIEFDKIYRCKGDQKFMIELFRKVVLNQAYYEKEFEGKTPNWEKDRIADLDMILIKMGICEFMHFPSIPTKATINEYLEIAKDYSTGKSSYFINGVLDKVCKDLEKSNRLNKEGRGKL